MTAAACARLTAPNAIALPLAAIGLVGPWEAAVGMAASRATPEDIAHLEAAYAGMQAAIEFGGDYVRHDLLFHQGLMRASHNRMMIQMSKAIGALLRTSFEISTSKPNGPANSLPLHRAVLDAVIAQKPERAERAARIHR